MRKKGFTLIELLVVISIIALLLSILMPGLQKAKAAAKALVCRTNQKNLASAFQGYYMDNRDRSMDSDGSYEFWFLQLGPYLSDGAFTEADYSNTDGTGQPKDPETLMKSSMAANKCPATKPPMSEWDPSASPQSQGIGGTAKNQYRYHMVRVEGSYTMNSWVGGYNGEFDPETWQGRDNLAQSFRGNPASGRGDVPVLADGVWVEALPLSKNDAPHDLSVVADDGKPDWRNGLQRFATNRHGLDTNVAYCDGHVEKIKLNELWVQRWSKNFKIDPDMVVPKDDDRGD